jgi:O-acetyl-ADP-ribose deacetylase (regulator of RNase III)
VDFLTDQIEVTTAGNLSAKYFIHTVPNPELEVITDLLE